MAQLALGVAGLALVLGLADAEDRLEARLQRRGHLLLQRAVGLAEVLAPLGVAEHHAVDAELGQHRRRDLAGVGALGLLVHVLGADAHAGRRAAADATSSAVNGTQIADVDAAAGIGQQREQALAVVASPRRASCTSSSCRRCSGVAQASSSASTPGQLLALEQLERRAAARGEMVDRVGQPELRPAPRRSRRRRRPSCRARPPPPRRRARVPAANGSISNAPIGPFQNTVPARAICSA